ncbi:MAG: hypothetical protein ABI681_10970 [Gemmatimonadales bacterium]
MSKGKTNALDALRALIAERQQYEQWISALEAKREGTPEHVLERVQADYRGRLERVIGDIRGHSEELQLSISTLSSRLVEVAREEDTKREGLQEAELRAAVGEYDPQEWEQLRTEGEAALKKIAADRASLDGQLGELRSIQKLSEVGSVGSPPGAAAAATDVPVDTGPPASEPSAHRAPDGESSKTPAHSGRATPSRGVTAVASAAESADRTAAQPGGGHRSGTLAADEHASRDRSAESTTSAASAIPRTDAPQSKDQGRLPLDPVAAAASAAATSTARPRGTRTPPGGTAAVRSKSDPAKADAAKTLKCPECGTPNYPTEWYCERCGGELATM